MKLNLHLMHMQRQMVTEVWYSSYISPHNSNTTDVDTINSGPIPKLIPRVPILVQTPSQESNSTLECNTRTCPKLSLAQMHVPGTLQENMRDFTVD